MIKRLRRRLTVILTAITGCILIAVLGISLWYTVEQTRFSSAERLTTDVGYLTISLDTTTGDSKHNLEVLDALGQEKDYVISFKVDGEPQVGATALTPAKKDLIDYAEEVVSDYSVSYSTTATTATLPTLFSSIALVERSDSFWVGSALTVDKNTVQQHVYDAKGNVLDDKVNFSSPDIDDAVSGEEGISVMFNYMADGYIYPTFQYDGTDYRVNSLEMINSENVTPVSYQLMIIEELTHESNHIFLIYLGYIALMLAGVALLAVGNWFLSKLVVKPTEEGLRRQTEFVAAASHELRSPLTTLRASLSAASISDTEEEAEKYRSCAMQEADRMGRLVSDLLILAGSDLLILAGSDSKKWGIQKRPFDVDTLLIETHEQYESAVKEKKRKLRLTLPDTALGEFTGDRDRIRQILSVLLDNAMEYSPEGSTILLKARKKNKRLLLSVIDEGAGIPEKEKKRIFDRFYRTDKSRSDKAHFGLGLSVAKELAQLHGGGISVHDEPEGGTRFTLTL